MARGSRHMVGGAAWARPGLRQPKFLSDESHTIEHASGIRVSPSLGGSLSQIYAQTNAPFSLKGKLCLHDEGPWIKYVSKKLLHETVVRDLGIFLGGFGGF